MNTLAFRLTASFVALVATACAPVPGDEATGEVQGPLEGVWSVVSVDPMDGSSVVDPSQPGLYIFTGSHYSAVYAPGPEPRLRSEESFRHTEDEMIAQYRSIIVNSGTYQVDGSSLTLRPMIAKSPNLVGGRLTGTFSISQDTLVLHHEHLVDVDGAEFAGFGETLTLVRLE